MKDLILKVAKDLEKGDITEDKAKSLLLSLFGVNGVQQPLNIARVSEMMYNISKEAWVTAGGSLIGFEHWIAKRDHVNLNSSNKTQ